MSVLVRLGQFILSFGILVLLHELGHFAMACLFRVRAEKFYVFFNPWFSLYKRRIGHTQFGIGWIPLGGYVKLAGMLDESYDTAQLAAPVQPYEFRAKPAWQRLLVILGGVMVNVLLAWAIYASLLLHSGETYLASRDVKYGIVADSLAQAMGFRSGDRILAVNGDSVENFAQLMTQAILTPDACVRVERAGEELDVTIPRFYLKELLNGRPLFGVRMPFVVDRVLPGSAAMAAGLAVGDSLLSIDGVPASYFDEFRAAALARADSVLPITVSRAGVTVPLTIQVPPSGTVGVQANAEYARFFRVSRREYSAFTAMVGGGRRVVSTLRDYVNSLKLFLVPEARAHESLGGFIAIGQIFPGEWDWVSFWSLTAFLSLALAVFNVLPIPGLDGGHALFILYEMITRRKPSQRFMVAAQTLGLILILFLALYANTNDIVKLFR